MYISMGLYYYITVPGLSGTRCECRKISKLGFNEVVGRMLPELYNQSLNSIPCENFVLLINIVSENELHFCGNISF